MSLSNNLSITVTRVNRLEFSAFFGHLPKEREDERRERKRREGGKSFSFFFILFFFCSVWLREIKTENQNYVSLELLFGLHYSFLSSIPNLEGKVSSQED